MKPAARILIAIAAAGVAACGAPELASVIREADQPESTLFRDVTVFDGIDVVAHRDVIITGQTIAAVGETGTHDAPSGAFHIDGAGRMLLPGLIDTHAHLVSAGEKHGGPPDEEAIGQAFLYAGVTTVLVAASPVDLASLRGAGRADELMPHLYTAGSGLTAPGGHPTSLFRAMLPWPIRWFAIRALATAADAAEARARVDAMIDARNPEFLKIIYDDLPPGSPHLSRAALEAAIAAARDRGVRAIVHTTTPEDTLTAVDAGASLLMHVPQRGELSPQQTERLAAARVPIVTTARLVSASHDLAAEGPIALERSMYPAELLDPWLDDPSWGLAGFSEEIDKNHDEAARVTAANVRALLAAGAELLVGTDSGVHGVFPGASLHRELRLLVRLGMPPVEALRAATNAPATFLDPEGRSGFGRIAVGQRADLLLVRGDPTQDIAALAAIDGVWLAGARLTRRGVDE